VTVGARGAQWLKLPADGDSVNANIRRLLQGIAAAATSPAAGLKDGQQPESPAVFQLKLPAANGGLATDMQMPMFACARSTAAAAFQFPAPARSASAAETCSPRWIGTGSRASTAASGEPQFSEALQAALAAVGRPVAPAQVHSTLQLELHSELSFG
jgi:hypothetical protein